MYIDEENLENRISLIIINLFKILGRSVFYLFLFFWKKTILFETNGLRVLKFSPNL